MAISPKVTIDPSSMPYGTATIIKITFSGYTQNGFVFWSFDGVDRIFLNCDQNGIAFASIGAGEASLLGPGTHVIIGVDLDTDLSASAVLTITGGIPSVPSLTLSPSQIKEGTSAQVQVQGKGFQGNRTVNILIDGLTVLSNMPVNSNGFFSWVVNINAEQFSARTLTITAIGNAGAQAQATLAIVSNLPPFFAGIGTGIIIAGVIVIAALILTRR